MGGEDGVEVGDLANPMNGDLVFSLEGEVPPELVLKIIWGETDVAFWEGGVRVHATNEMSEPEGGFPFSSFFAFLRVGCR